MFQGLAWGTKRPLGRKDLRPFFASGSRDIREVGVPIWSDSCELQ